MFMGNGGGGLNDIIFTHDKLNAHEEQSRIFRLIHEVVLCKCHGGDEEVF